MSLDGITKAIDSYRASSERHNPSSFFQIFEISSVWAAFRPSSLIRLHLEGNPFSCSCEIEQFVNWADVLEKINPGVITKFDQLKCDSSNPEVSKEIKFRDFASETCEDLPLVMQMINSETEEVIYEEVEDNMVMEDLSIKFYVRCYHNSTDPEMRTRLFSRGQWQKDNKVVVQRLYEELLVTCVTSKVWFYQPCENTRFLPWYQKFNNN